MKYKTKKTSNSRDHFNAWQLATKGGKLSRVSLSKYRKAYQAAERLHCLNTFADRVAMFDNDASRYTEEKSARLNKRLEEDAQRVAELLAPLGLEFFNCSHLYGVAVKGSQNQIYLKY